MSSNGESGDDTELMLRAAAGDNEAFCRLVRRHGPSLVSFFSANGAGSDAEDLAQRTFLKIHSMRRRYAAAAKFTTFLFVVARRVLVDHLRAASRLAALHERAGAEVETTEEAPRTRGEAEDAEAALAALSPPLREAVVLVVMRGLEYHEAAEALGVPTGTVKSRVHDALRRMREALLRQ